MERNAQYNGAKLFIWKGLKVTYITFLQIKILKHPKDLGT